MRNLPSGSMLKQFPVERDKERATLETVGFPLWESSIQKAL